MKGPAGVGKSAVAQTCAENLKDMEYLGASFFFSIKGRNKPEKFFPSIAYQLSTIHPPYRDLLEGKIRNDKTLIKKAMSFQFKYLIDEPLRELASQGKGLRRRIAVIIDGLDECEGVDAQCEIIRIIAAAVSDSPLPLCWAFFSRPEPHIEAHFSKPMVTSHCHKILLPVSRDADGEIEVYLRNGFENILQRRNSSVPHQWPSANDIEILVGAAAGLFIYATTVIRFVDHLSQPGPQKRLCAIIDTILDRRKNGPRAGTGTDTPYADLDAFYVLILQRIPKEIFPSVHLLLAVICRYGLVGAILTTNLLGLSKDEFETICHHASAVVLLQDPETGLKLDPAIDTSRGYMQANLDQDVLLKLDQSVYRELGGHISFYHKSFEDFLLDPVHSSRYCVKNLEVLAQQYRRMHLTYDLMYRWEHSGGLYTNASLWPTFLTMMSVELVTVPSVDDSAPSLSYPYTNELVNSFIKAMVYTHVGVEDTDSFSVLGRSGVFDVDVDFRKRLHIVTYIDSVLSPFSVHTWLWGCKCRFKLYVGTEINLISLAEFNVNEFKSVSDSLRFG